MIKFLKSFIHAFRGIRMAAFRERNFTIQLIVGIGSVFAARYFTITKIEWLIMLLCVGLVLSLELINSAIEQAVNLASKEMHPIAATAKDFAAGAVLMASIISFIVGLIIFVPYVQRALAQ